MGIDLDKVFEKQFGNNNVNSKKKKSNSFINDKYDNKVLSCDASLTDIK
jgi:hypothetical protein